MKSKNLFPNLGSGMGLRSQHYSHIATNKPKLEWFEALSENYMGLSQTGSGRPLQKLESIRQDYEIVLHGVSMSVGSTDELNFDYLKRLKSLASRIEPQWISDHLCWTGVKGENMHDLLPLPFTKEAVSHLVDRILRIQDFLQQRILLENVSSYMTFAHSELTEWQFLSEISQQADCGILLDINNVYVNSVNHGFDPLTYIKNLPTERIGQIHLAGHSKLNNILIDTHDSPVCDEVWDLFRQSINIIGEKSTMIERDDNIPEFAELYTEIQQVQKIIHEENKVEHGQNSLFA